MRAESCNCNFQVKVPLYTLNTDHYPLSTYCQYVN